MSLVEESQLYNVQLLLENVALTLRCTSVACYYVYYMPSKQRWEAIVVLRYYTTFASNLLDNIV